jgi:serpin B
MDMAKLLIIHGADVSMNDMSVGSPLHVAARTGDLQLAELLLTRGVDVDEKDGGGNAPLHCAARRDNRTVAQRLIAYHAEVNLGNWGGTTPLHYAVAEGHREMALLLLANGADVNVQDKDGDTPLHTAATRGRKEIVELLLQRGAATGVADAGGRTPVEEAKRYRHAEIVSLLQRVPAQAATTTVARKNHGERQAVLADAPAGSPSETNPLRVEKVVLSEADRARRNVKSVVAGNSAFALDLYRQLASTKEGNLFFSPYSISTALAMTYAGARANTETQMAQVLHFPVDQEDLHPVFAHLEATMAAVQKTGDIKLHVANALWPQQGQPFLPEYLALVKRYYGVSITAVDYVTEKSRAAAIKTINTWVEGRTENRIRDLLQPRHVNEATRLVLTNAIYFKGNWEHQFDPNDTQDAPFHVTPTRSVTVPMMTQTETLRYGELKDVQVLELAYRGGELSLLVVLPKAQDGLEQIEKTLSAGDLDQWRHSLREQEVIVFLPKFKTTFEVELKKTLKAMGMVDAFTWPGANFAGFNGDSRWFVIGEVVHKAYVDVNEEGTEAAAATAVVMMVGGAPPRPPEFRADHPFLFLIQENRTGSILFLGRVVNPR